VCPPRRDSRTALFRPSFENYTVVASAFFAETGRRARLKPGAHPGVQARLLPDVHTTSCVVGEIEYHPWLLSLNSGFESLAAHLPQAPLAEWCLAAGS